MNSADHSDDKDLELMFAEARRYPLLTPEQEREIDGRKWVAVRGLHHLFVDAPSLRVYFADFCGQCLSNPPDISRFDNRDQHFVLRRELAAYFIDGTRSAEARALHQKLLTARSTKTRRALSDNLQIPASLTIGMAVTMLRRAGGQLADSVADSIRIWERQWHEPISSIALAREEAKTLRHFLRVYTEARDALVMHNLRLVYSIAARYRNRGVSYLDLVQEGTLGLIRASEKFEFEKGFRFSTYCFNWITQAVRRHVGDVGSLIRFPTHVQEQMSRLYKEKAIEHARTGFEPDDKDLAARLGMDINRTRELLQLRNMGVSLDAPRFADGDGSVIDSIVGETYGGTEDSAEQISLHKFLTGAIDQLEQAEQQVVTARWGLHDGPPLSRTEIADIMGVSREWVRQLERNALKKLRAKTAVQDAFEDYSTV